MKTKIKHLSGLFFSETARNTYAVFVGNFLSAFFSFIFTVTLVRILTLSDFGYFSALLSLMILTTELSDIGIGQSLSSFLPPLNKTLVDLKSFLKASFLLQFLIALTVSVLIIIFSKTVSLLLFHDKSYSFMVVLTGVGIFCSVFATFVNYALSAQKKFLSVAFLTSFGGLIRLLFLALLLYTLSVNLYNAVFSQTLSLIIWLAVSFAFLKLDFLKFAFKPLDVKRLLKFAYLLGLARAFTAISFRLDVLMLTSLKGGTEAGIYSIASRIISLYPLLAGSFLSVIAPKISTISGLAQLKKYLKKIILATSGLILTIFVMIIFAYPFITLLFGEKTASAVPVFQLLLISMIFFVASVPAVAIAVFFLKKPAILTVNAILQLIIVVFGNLYFIPLYGRLGPAFSLILAYGATFAITSLMTAYFWQEKRK